MERESRTVSGSSGKATEEESSSAREDITVSERTESSKRREEEEQKEEEKQDVTAAGSEGDVNNVQANPKNEELSANKSVQLSDEGGDVIVLGSPVVLSGYLPWEQDLEMISIYEERKECLNTEYKKYLTENPQVSALLADFLQAIFIQRPDNVYKFAREFFKPFDPVAPSKPSLPTTTQ